MMRSRTTITRVAAALTLMGWLAAIVPSAYAQGDPKAVVQQLDAALIAKDLDAALALWAPDAEARQAPPPPGFSGHYQGTDEIRAWLQFLIDQNVHFDLAVEHVVDGEQVTWTNNTSIDPWRRLGVAPLQGKAIATVHDGKIATFSVTLTPESMRRLQQAMANAPTNPNTVAKGNFTYSATATGHNMIGLRECEQNTCAVVSIGTVSRRMRGAQNAGR